MSYLTSNRISIDVLERFQNGDSKAFEFIYNHCCETIYFFAFRIVRNKEAAEDLTADAFTKLWMKRETIAITDKIIPYLYMIIRNACLDYNKGIKAKVRRYKEVEYLSSQETEIEILHDMIRAEVTQELYMAINALPPQCEKVFQRLFIDGKNYTEIAEEMAIKIGTVRSQKVRGLSLLRLILGFGSLI